MQSECASIGKYKSLLVSSKRQIYLFRIQSCVLQGGGGVARGLFAASEKRISRVLDRGLQDLEEGRVSIPRTNDDMSQFDNNNDDNNGVDQVVKWIVYRNAVEVAVSASSKQT